MYSTEESEKESTLSLQNRKTLSIDGVRDVMSFDERAVILQTALGTLTVEGGGLHILHLDLSGGLVTVEGNITALLYTDKVGGTKGGFFSRMVR